MNGGIRRAGALATLTVIVTLAEPSARALLPQQPSPSEVVPDRAIIDSVSAGPQPIQIIATIKANAPFSLLGYGTKLRRAGWLGEFEPGRAFIAAGGTRGGWSLCKGAEFLALRYEILGSGDRVFRFSLSHDPARTCIWQQGEHTSNRMTPIVTLAPGIVSVNYGGSGSSGDTEQHVQLNTKVSVDELVQQLIPQVTAAGWRVTHGPTGDAEVSVTGLDDATQPDGRGILAVARVSESIVDVELAFFAGAPPTAGRQPLTPNGGRGAASPTALLLYGPGVERRTTPPPDFPAAAIPKDVSVTAVSVSPSMTVVVGSLAPGRGLNPNALAVQLEQDRWLIDDGEVSFVAPGDVTTVLTACRDDRRVTIDRQTVDETQRLVRIAVEPADPARCTLVGRGPGLARVMPAMSIDLPPATVSMTTLEGFGGAENTTVAHMATALNVSALADHFARELDGVGWIVDRLSTPANVRVQRLHATSRRGDPIVAVLVLTPAAPGSIELFLRVIGFRPARPLDYFTSGYRFLFPISQRSNQPAM